MVDCTSLCANAFKYKLNPMLALKWFDGPQHINIEFLFQNTTSCDFFFQLALIYLSLKNRNFPFLCLGFS